MTQSTVEDLKKIILNELTVIEDDIHVTRDDSLTFYLPLNELDQAKNVLDVELEVLEKHKHEYLISVS